MRQKKMNIVWRRAAILVGVLITLVAPLFVFAPAVSAAPTCRPSPLQPRNNANDLTDVAYDQYKYNLTADGRCLLTVDNKNQCPVTAHTEATATARQCWECPVGYTDTGGAGNDNEKWVPGAAGSCKAPAGSTDPTVPTCGGLAGFTYQKEGKYAGYCTGPKVGACPAGSKDTNSDSICIANATDVPDAATGKCKTGWTKVMKDGKGSCVHTVPNTLEEVNPDTGDDEEAAADGCPVEPGVEFRWALCPVFFIMSGITTSLDYFIDSYMTIGNQIFDDASNGYEDAWTVFRNLAIGLVVLAGLVMLASEAFGVPLMDAYTVRKVLPRLLVAIVGIAISWELCKFLIGLFDDLGHAAGTTIYSAFGIKEEGINLMNVIGQYLILGGAATGAAILLTGGGVLSLLGTLILAMLAGAVALIIRQAIIIACVIFAPLAIAAYILPNTNKIAGMWWNMLWRMLAMYPLATGIIALCKVLSKITMGV